MDEMPKVNETVDTSAFDKLTEESLDKIGEVIDNPESSGMDILAVLLAMPDEDFETLRPIFQDSMVKAYFEPQNQMQLINLFAQSGISIDDLINNSDIIADNLFKDTDIELSDSKKDFIKFLFSSAATAISASTINPAHVVEIPIELCREDAKMPSYATNGSAAMDIYSPEEYTIAPGETIIIPIGIKVSIPHGYALLIQPRSGLSRKTKIRIANTPGLIDEDYHEEIGVIVENIDSPVKQIGMELVNNELIDGTLYGSSFTIGKGERFAQMRLVEVPRIRWREVTSLGSFENDHGAGFGSTGKE